MTPVREAPQKWRRAEVWGFFVVCFVALIFVHQKQFDAASPVSRLNLLHSLFVHRSFHIDPYHENTSDKSFFQGHFYSDKAPGTVAAVLGGFGLSALVLRWADVPLDAPLGWLVSSWMSAALGIAPVVALGAVAMRAFLLRFVDQRAALLTSGALFLGAAPLPYSTMLFPHALTVALLAIAIWAMEAASPGSGGSRQGVTEVGWTDARAAFADVDRGRNQFLRSRMGRWVRAHRWDLVAGHACGWALASEYTAGIVVLGLMAWLLRRGSRRIIPFCLGALPPLLLIPAYSYACFRNPFILPYSWNASYPEMQQGLYAIKWPDPGTAFKLLFSPTRGLFFWSPFLLLAVFGYRELGKRCPRLFWLTYAVPLLQIVVISGRVWDWQAGPTLGPRFLAAILPLLALPCALGIQRFPRLGMVLAVYSIGITTLATLTDACPTATLYNPLLELHIPLFLRGEFSPNLGMALGLPPYASVALFYGLLIGGFLWLWRRSGPRHSPSSTAPLG